MREKGKGEEVVEEGEAVWGEGEGGGEEGEKGWGGRVQKGRVRNKGDWVVTRVRLRKGERRNHRTVSYNIKQTKR